MKAIIPQYTDVDTTESSFRAALADAGLEYAGPIILDGQLHRIKVNGDRKPNSWYVLHGDGLAAGSLGCWKRGINETWCAKTAEALTADERQERDRKWRQQQAEREQERRRIHDEARDKAQAILDAARDATDDHPYLVRKQVKAHPYVRVGPWPQRQLQDCLLVPLRNATGQLATVQAIFPDKFADGRDKDFLKGGEKRGAYFGIGDIATAETIIIAEGYATAATLHEATGHPAVMAVDAGNLQPVAEVLHALYPRKRFIIAADNDSATPGNPGLTKAKQAAHSIQAGIAVPEFAEGGPVKDFNDVFALHGMEAVRATIARTVKGSRETYSGTRQAGAAVGGDSIALDAYRGTDDANAELFLRSHGSDVRFCPPWDKWLLWTGSHWRMDDRLDIDRLAADVPRLLYLRAGEAADSGERRKIAALAGKLERTALRATMLIAARHRVAVHHSDLDQGHFLLNTANGTVDLHTGQLRPHDRADLLTHDTDIHYHQNATAPTWTRFLADVFAGDADLIQFVQRAIGYSLTGDVREQVLLICHGFGSNGKSVFLNILRALLGKLALQAAPDLLMADRNRRHPTEQADLFGRRCVVCQETGEGRRFNETLVKQLTGGDAIRARRMHEDFWEFAPTHKLWLSTNHRPEIRGTDYAIWRRIRLIPFGVRFTDDGEPRKDPLMEERLMAELPGILAWAVAGCLDWQRNGLGTAEAVKKATANYQAEMDVLAAWLEDCCVTGERCEAKASSLYASYTDWCNASGETAEPQRKWGMRLTERGLRRAPRRNGIFYLGIGLLASDREPCEGCEPKKAIFRAASSRGSNNAKSGSQGSQGSQHPPADDPPSPDSTGSLPVDFHLNPPVGTVGGDTTTTNPLQARIDELVAEGWHPVNARARAEQVVRAGGAL